MVAWLAKRRRKAPKWKKQVTLTDEAAQFCVEHAFDPDTMLQQLARQTGILVRAYIGR